MKINDLIVVVNTQSKNFPKNEGRGDSLANAAKSISPVVASAALAACSPATLKRIVAAHGFMESQRLIEKQRFEAIQERLRNERFTSGQLMKMAPHYHAAKRLMRMGLDDHPND